MANPVNPLNNGGDLLNETQNNATIPQGFLEATLNATSNMFNFTQGHPETRKLFQGTTLKSLLLWEHRTESAIVAGSLLSFIVIFGILGYTMLTFICRSLQLALLVFAGSAYLGKPLVSSDEMVGKLRQIADTFSPLAWDTVDTIARILTWENRTQTMEVFVGSLILAALGNYFSDLTLLFLVTVAFFVGPAVYVKNKAEIDGHMGTFWQTLDKFVAQSAEQMRQAAASLSPSITPNHSPNRNSTNNAAGATAGASSPPSLYGGDKKTN